jgi:hypothetical protein
VVVIAVEEVSGRAPFTRFFEQAYLMFQEEPRWVPPLVSYERWRLDPHRNPFFAAGDGAYFLLRRMGKPAGRITAHVAADGDEQGWFGFYDVVDDPACTVALVDAAAEWLRAKGCTTMTGPASLTVEEESGVLVDGFDVPGTTGRQWHPPWYSSHLESAGLVRGEERPTWRLPTAGSLELMAETGALTPFSHQHSPLAGPYRDPGIVFGGIEAVPDLSIARGSVRRLAKRAKRHDWETATVVRLDGHAATLVPQLVRAAADRGYADVITPWSPDPEAPPETVHALYSMKLK